MIVPFSLSHVAQMTFKDDVSGTMARPEMAPALEWLAKTSNGRTLVSADGKTILGVLGVVPMTPGVCEVFIIASEQQKDHPLTFARAIRKELFTLKAKFRRIQAVSKPDAFHRRWLSWLGFLEEGLLKKYGLDGEDMLMWGLTA